MGEQFNEMRLRGGSRTGTILMALALSALSVGAHAQTPDSESENLAPARQPLTPEEAAALGNILTFGPENPAFTSSLKPLKLPALADPQTLAVTRADKADGSSTVTIKRTLPTEWQTNFGADLNVRTAPIPAYDPQALFGKPANDNSGAAWASFGIANVATIDTRVDPTKDQGKLGTTLKQSLPVGDKFKVTLQDTYSMTESLSAAIGAADVPPLPNFQNTGTNTGTVNTTPVFGNQQTVKFDILPTGTSLAAALNSNNADPVAHKSLSADQKILGPLHISTTVSDIGQPTLNKSIVGSFKLNW